MADSRDGTMIGRAHDGTLRSLILVDDGGGQFGPLCDLRPVFGLRTGAGTQAERIAERLGLAVAAYRVPERLAASVAASSGVPTNALPPAGIGDAPDDAPEHLVVSGRLVASAAQAALCRTMLARAEERIVVTGDGSLVAARLGRTAVAAFLRTGDLPASIERVAASADLLATPWQLLDGLGTAISEDIQRLRERGESDFRELPADHAGRMGPHPVLIHASAAIAPFVVFDASAGPILVGEGASIRPFAVLCGPCSIGAGSTIADRALIKPNTTCGPQCRLGGEIGGTSIVGRSNKTHDGHLGDSVIGEWVNLGAGTDNSNLLNTYGEVPVRLEPDGPRQRSGRIFLGAIVGDHVKCAIGTRLMTGTVIGTGAMIASSTPPPSTVERFAWITDEGALRYALPKFIEVMRTVMRRRALTPSDAYVALVERLHEASGSASGEARRGDGR